MAVETAPLLEMRGVTKIFGRVKALDGVDLTLRRGEVHALMGENGAGKSTLIKVLTGVHARNGGEVVLDGTQVDARSPGEALRLGISTVYQEVNLLPYLSVAENLYLGRQPSRFGLIDWRRMRRGAEAALARLEIRGVDVTAPLQSLSLAVQQMVAIARALDVSAKLLILDEPTSSLDADEVRQLFAAIRRVKAEGLGVLIVTHFLDQVYEISDRMTILRNGRSVGEHATASLPRAELIAAMMGRELAAVTKPADAPAPATTAAPLVQVRGLGKRGRVKPVSFDVAAGETVGLAGLLGSGRTEVARLVFGADQPDEGQVLVDGQPASLKSPRAASRLGFAFLPEDRKADGIVPDLSIRENLVLALQARRGWLRPLSRKRQDELVERYMRALGVAAASAEQPIKTLSGGNQQKVLLARWLAAEPRLLILDEPTRGIDVGAKAEIQKLIMSLCREGKAILLISSELEEVVRCSQRVVVLKDRAKVAELAGAAVTETGILGAMAAEATP